MPRGQQLSDFERGRILAYQDMNLPPIIIVEKIGRAKSTISKFLQDPENYGRKKRPGRPRTLDPRAERRLISAARRGEQSASQLKNTQDIPLTTRRVQQILSSVPDLKYKKRKGRPMLKQIHIQTKLQWATEKVHWTTK
jgi:transposase